MPKGVYTPFPPLNRLDEVEEETLPRKLQQRNRPAVGLARLAYERYSEELKRFLLRRSDSSEHTARDLAQEVYLRLLRVDQEKFPANPQGYMYRVASHVVYEYLVKAEVEPVTYNSELMAAVGERAGDEAADATADRMDAETELKEILAQLPQRYRHVFLLRRRDGFSIPEIARQTGLSAHTIKKYLMQALAQLRALHLEWQGPGGRS